MVTPMILAAEIPQNAAIMISMNDLLKACGALATIALAISWIAKGVKILRAPNDAQDAKLAELEQFKESATDHLDKDHKRLISLETWRAETMDTVQSLTTQIQSQDKRLQAIEDGNRATQKAILALMSYEVDGDKDGLAKAQTDFSTFLVDKK